MRVFCTVYGIGKQVPSFHTHQPASPAVYPVYHVNCQPLSTFRYFTPLEVYTNVPPTHLQEKSIFQSPLIFSPKHVPKNADMGNKSPCTPSNPPKPEATSYTSVPVPVFVPTAKYSPKPTGKVKESSSRLYDPKQSCRASTKAVAKRRNTLHTSCRRVVAAEMLRPASRVRRTWRRRSMSAWLCEAREWVKTTRKGAKEEKSRILR